MGESSGGEGTASGSIRVAVEALLGALWLATGGAGACGGRAGALKFRKPCRLESIDWTLGGGGGSTLSRFEP